MAIDTVVVGAGQAGLAMSRELSAAGRDHVVLERARVAERWRSEHWDSLMFQFPNWSIALPGRTYAGGDPEGFAAKDEVLRFVVDYAEAIRAPVRTGANVTALRALRGGNGFEVESDVGRFAASNVVVATGPYQRPVRPRWHQALPAGLLQIDAARYRNPGELPPGTVLVVGAGASGCQIADELLEAGRAFAAGVRRRRSTFSDCRSCPRRSRRSSTAWARTRIAAHVAATQR